MSGVRLLYVVGAVAALALLFVLLRPGDDRDAAAPTASVPTTTADATGTTATQTQEPVTTEGATTASTPPVIRWRVDTRDDELDRLTVARGTRVRLVAIADVTDHVHVHGYDLMRDIAPGAPAVIQFRARLVGRFEIELEDQGRPIAQLTVEP